MEKAIIAEIAEYLLKAGYDVQEHDEWQIIVLVEGRSVMIDIWHGDIVVYRNWDDFGDGQREEYLIDLADPNFLELVIKFLPGI